MDKPANPETQAPVVGGQPEVNAVTPQVEYKEVEKVVEEVETPAFYETWNFWIILFLILNLAVAFYIWALPVFLPRIVVENQELTQEFTIKKVVAPSNGFFVLQRGIEGIPGFIIAHTQLLIPDTYTNFKISLPGEEDLPLEVLESIKPGETIYATFYKDVNSDGVYAPEIDSEIAKNIFGSKYQTKFIIKSTP